MKFSPFDKAFGPHLPSTKSFAATYAAAFSALDPAPYSLSEPHNSKPSGKSSPKNLAAAAAVAAAAVGNPITSLPGCAARHSMDLANARPKAPGGVAGNPHCCQQNDLRNPRDVRGSHSGTITPAAAVVEAVAAPVQPVRTPRQQHRQQLTAQPPPSRLYQQVPPGQRQSIQVERDVNPTRRNYRPSIDAAAGATMLYTCPATDAAYLQPVSLAYSSPLAAAATTAGATACEVPGFISGPAPVPFAQIPPPPLPPASSRMVAAVGSEAEQASEWDFGDNLHRARLLARYAAMAAAEEMRYDPAPSTAAAIGSDSEDGGGGGNNHYRKTHSPWRLMSLLLSSSKSSDGKSVPTSHRGSDGAECAGGEESSEPAVVRSRDSRRLLRAQRSRVGIDQPDPKQKQPVQLASGRVSAPAFTVEYQQQREQLKQQHRTQRQVRSLGSAPSRHRHKMQYGDVGGHDEEEEEEEEEKGDENELSAAVVTAGLG
ncbi:hypothetical protein Vafri_11979 [Volvox africanus]|uniref:Uncharacterized protein n=1 Tax=Volvox africanus TaxID=51714 RepID=A0A8J4BA34_9CHLO|nr:hypothetical protein Vafri_11979 [Volvox africanus]